MGAGCTEGGGPPARAVAARAAAFPFAGWGPEEAASQRTPRMAEAAAAFLARYIYRRGPGARFVHPAFLRRNARQLRGALLVAALLSPSLHFTPAAGGWPVDALARAAAAGALIAALCGMALRVFGTPSAFSSSLAVGAAPGSLLKTYLGAGSPEALAQTHFLAGVLLIPRLHLSVALALCAFDCAAWAAWRCAGGAGAGGGCAAVALRGARAGAGGRPQRARIARAAARQRASTKWRRRSWRRRWSAARRCCARCCPPM